MALDRTTKWICDKCGEPATGSFDSDDDRDESDPARDKFYVTMKCVSCSHEQKYRIEPEILYWEEVF